MTNKITVDVLKTKLKDIGAKPVGKKLVLEQR
jgi:hypothetical protein